MTGFKFVLFFFLSGLHLVETEMKTVIKTEGETVSLHSAITKEQSVSKILWLVVTGSSIKLIARLIKGEFTADYRQRFRDRLQLDRLTWSLNISNLNCKDTGVYKILIITSEERTDLTFNLMVYSPVPKPVITLNTQKPSASCTVSSTVRRKSCSVLCSVKNAREVSLSWQREGETLCNTSSPDLNSTLSLPLDIEENSATFTCVAENPASNQSVPLSTEEFCPLSPDSNKTRTYILIAVLISLAVIGFVLFIVKLLKGTGSENSGNSDVDRVSDEPQYADIDTRIHLEQTQPMVGELSRLDVEGEDRVVYADVRQ